MPIISKIGARSWKVRLAYGLIFLALMLGAVTMLYPFSLMLAGSVKSEADLATFTPYPKFWFDRTVLFQKYVESKHNADFTLAESAWGRAIGSWRLIEPPPESNLLEDFLLWREKCPHWWLGHTGGLKMLPVNAREFRRAMSDRFGGDLEAFNRAMSMPLKSWNSVMPPPPNPFRVPQEPVGLVGALQEFARSRPQEDRVLANPDGDFCRRFLVARYADLAEYNSKHAGRLASYEDVFLDRRAPDGNLTRRDWEDLVRSRLPTGLIDAAALAEAACRRFQARQDWEDFVRGNLSIEFIRVAPAAEAPYRRFLAAKYAGGIGEYNAKHGTKHSDFSQVPLPASAPESRTQMVDWKDFIADASACPLEALEVYGPRQSFEEFVATRRRVPVEKVGNLRLPIAAADWRDCMAHASSLRWEFTTRNYRHVLEYILLHGRGISNTLIYCGLAILLALLVNPLAAYALSRYKPPTTYTILLFCMTTMAFPGEVTMIPAFLLLKRFPLWPLLGGGAAFGVAVWLLSRLRPRWSEMLRILMALAVGLFVGTLVIPAAMGVWHVSLLNTFAALVVPGMANGYSIFLLKGFFDSLPRELYEAADIDGASEWRKFWTFTMALSKPILAVIALGAFFGAYSAFMMALIIVPDQSMWTLMVWVYQLQTEAHQSVIYAAVALTAIPTLLVFIFCQSIIIRGIVIPTEK
jgi:multiple sugar transport system permease protein